MKLTNGEIFDSKEHLQGLIPQTMPALSSLGLQKLTQAINLLLVPIEETRMKLLKEYGEVDKQNPQTIRIEPMNLVPDENNEGRMLSVPNPKAEAFVKDWMEIRAVENDVELEIVTVPSTIEISVLGLTALEKFIKVK